MDRHEAMYAADMKAQAAVEICESASVTLIRSRATGMWFWKRGPDISHDVGGGVFETKDEAAIDFTQSESFRLWLRSRGVNT